MNNHSVVALASGFLRCSAYMLTWRSPKSLVKIMRCVQWRCTVRGSCHHLPSSFIWSFEWPILKSTECSSGLLKGVLSLPPHSASMFSLCWWWFIDTAKNITASWPPKGTVGLPTPGVLLKPNSPNWRRLLQSLYCATRRLRTPALAATLLAWHGLEQRSRPAFLDCLPHARDAPPGHERPLRSCLSASHTLTQSGYCWNLQGGNDWLNAWVWVL